MSIKNMFKELYTIFYILGSFRFSLSLDYAFPSRGRYTPYFKGFCIGNFLEE